MKYEIKRGSSGAEKDTAIVWNEDETRFTSLVDSDDAAYWVDFELDAPIDDSFIMIPACAYNGNRFETVNRGYPPMFLESEMGVDVPVRMAPLPHLEPKGDSFMDVTTGDMATPCVCVLRKSMKQAFFVFFNQESHELNHGVTLEQTGDKLLIRLRAPSKRRLVYHMARMSVEPESDPPMSVKKGDEIVIEHRVFTLHCDSITELYRLFFEKRQVLYHGAPQANLPFSRYWELAEKRMQDHYIEKDGYYAIKAADDRFSKFSNWQAGWVGGGISTLPLMVEGSELSRKRSVDTLEFAGRTQSKAGWFYGIWAEGKIYYDDFEYYGERYSITMLRKHADLTYYMYRQIESLEAMGYEVPEFVKNSARRAADAMVTVWEKYGQFGQFINAETGEIVVGGSTAGGIVPAALCLAARYTGDKRYACVAEAAGELMYRTATQVGVTTGGPGEILQAPDSESSAALPVSYLELYEMNGDEKWLERAKEAAYQLSTWVVSYDYHFPKDTKFGKMGILATGSVWASVQNKHSAPGLCTISPIAYLKLYRYTADVNFLMIMRDIAHFIPQVASYPERPMLTNSGKPLPPSEICERVNLSDWEGRSEIGGNIGGSSVWPEITMMLTWLDIPGVYAVPSRGIVCASDHVNAWLDGGELFIQNTTDFDACVKVLIEDDEKMKRKLGAYWQDMFKRVSVPSGSTVHISANID